MNVAYTGDWADGAPHGDGTAEWHPVRSGAVIAAEKKKAAEGGAPLSPPVPQQRYSGQWVGGAPEGEGCFSWKDGSSYKGQWKGGERHGEGAWIPQPSNDTPKRPPPMSEDRIIAIVDLYGESFRPPQYLQPGYVGQWEEGCGMHGQGKWIGTNLWSYEGQWVGGQPHGVGKVRDAEGGLHHGKMKGADGTNAGAREGMEVGDSKWSEGKRMPDSHLFAESEHALQRAKDAVRATAGLGVMLSAKSTEALPVPPPAAPAAAKAGAKKKK